jgi:hypothetical protein
MAAMSASVSLENWRQWLQAKNSSGVILMTVFSQREQQRVSLSFSRVSIPEIGQKCDPFDVIAGASAKYLGEREGYLAKKRGDERKKSHSRCHAILCGRGNPLKVLGSVAFFLANGIFIGQMTGILGEIASAFGLVNTASKIGDAMADNSMTLPESDDSWMRLADRYGVDIEFEDELETFKRTVDYNYCDRMIENGQDEADDNSRGFFSRLLFGG